MILIFQLYLRFSLNTKFSVGFVWLDFHGVSLVLSESFPDGGANDCFRHVRTGFGLSGSANDFNKKRNSTLISCLNETCRE